MIYGAIDKDGERYYTFLKDIFSSLKDKQKEYNWLITECDIVANSTEPDALNHGEYHFLTGDELTSIVEKDDGQWIWGVLSGFDKNISLDKILEYPLPTADNNASLWKNPISMLHPLSSLEIIPFDSSFVLLLSTKKEHVDMFRACFSGSEDLSTYNSK